MDSRIITINNQIFPKNYLDIWDKIPLNIKNLLFFTDEIPPENLDRIGISLSFSPENGVNIGKLGIRNDPSTIYFSMPVTIPINIGNVSPPFRYPKYYKLTAEQKYVYLNWLHDIDQPIDEGYRHLFFFGLERQLIIGDFDAAWKMILKLRKAVTMNDYFFIANSEKTLFTACFFYNRHDLLSEMKYLFDNRGWSNTQILIKYYIHEPIEAFETINILNGTKVNQRYFDIAPKIYIEEMTKLLIEKVGHSFIRAEDFIKEEKKEKSMILGFHNYSLPYELRKINILLPDTSDLIIFLKGIHSECHERTKERLRKKRKRNKI